MRKWLLTLFLLLAVATFCLSDTGKQTYSMLTEGQKVLSQTHIVGKYSKTDNTIRTLQAATSSNGSQVSDYSRY